MKKSSSKDIKDPPVALTPNAADVWRRFFPKYCPAEEDLPIFEIFCESFSRWRALLDKSDEQGAIVRLNGGPIPNPHLSRADKEAEKIRRIVKTLADTKNARKFREDNEP